MKRKKFRNLKAALPGSLCHSSDLAAVTLCIIKDSWIRKFLDMQVSDLMPLWRDSLLRKSSIPKRRI